MYHEWVGTVHYHTTVHCASTCTRRSLQSAQGYRIAHTSPVFRSQLDLVGQIQYTHRSPQMSGTNSGAGGCATRGGRLVCSCMRLVVGADMG